MYTKQFWKDTTERVISTAAQAAVGALGTTAVLSRVNWTIVLGTAGGGALMSLLKCLVAAQKGDPSSASLVE
jgi:hypothetical protein